MSKKRPNTLFNMASTLLIIASVAGLGLSALYNVTKEPIAQVQQKKIQQMLEKVLPPFERVERRALLPYDNSADSLIVFDAFDTNNELIGRAVITYSYNGFSGFVQIMVGFLPDFTIHKIEVLKHAETPGLGDKMESSKSTFAQQFFGKNPETFQLKVKKDGGDVDAITAATISSRAYCDAVERAYKTLLQYQQNE